MDVRFDTFQQLGPLWLARTTPSDRSSPQTLYLQQIFSRCTYTKETARQSRALQMRCSLAFCVFEAWSLLKWKGWTSSQCSCLSVRTYNRDTGICALSEWKAERCLLQLHPHLGTDSKLHAKRDLGCSEDAGRTEMPNMHAGKVLCRWWNRGVSGTLHLPSPHERAGMPAALPCSLPAPNTLFPAWRGAQPWQSGMLQWSNNLCL